MIHFQGEIHFFFSAHRSGLVMSCMFKFKNYLPNRKYIKTVLSL